MESGPRRAPDRSRPVLLFQDQVRAGQAVRVAHPLPHGRREKGEGRHHLFRGILPCTVGAGGNRKHRRRGDGHRPGRPGSRFLDVDNLLLRGVNRICRIHPGADFQIQAQDRIQGRARRLYREGPRDEMARNGFRDPHHNRLRNPASNGPGQRGHHRDGEFIPYPAGGRWARACIPPWPCDNRRHQKHLQGRIGHYPVHDCRIPYHSTDSHCLPHQGSTLRPAFGHYRGIWDQSRMRRNPGINHNDGCEEGHLLQRGRRGRRCHSLRLGRRPPSGPTGPGPVLLGVCGYPADMHCHGTYDPVLGNLQHL